MRFLLLALLAASVCGCNIIYKLPTRQGNVIEQKELDKLMVGMSRDQVRFVLGTPMASNGLQSDRWDYLGYYKSPRGKTFNRVVNLYFEGDSLARIVGAEAPAKSKVDAGLNDAAVGADAGPEEPPAEPADSGVVITPK